MRLVYKFNIGQNENISSLCKISNNLYNQALYIFRETLSKEGKWLSYFEKGLHRRDVVDVPCYMNVLQKS